MGVRRWAVVAALAVPLPLAGCGALGLGSASTIAPTTTRSAGSSWTVVTTGSATPSPSLSGGGSASPTAASASLAPASSACATSSVAGQTLIPLTITSATGSLTVTWPRYGSTSTYRIAAVAQRLVNGAQPVVAWQSVAGGTGCTATGTITGLTSGDPYIVWLDAVDAGQLRDGAPAINSGRSQIVYPT